MNGLKARQADYLMSAKRLAQLCRPRPPGILRPFAHRQAQPSRFRIRHLEWRNDESIERCVL